MYPEGFQFEINFGFPRLAHQPIPFPEYEGVESYFLWRFFAQRKSYKFKGQKVQMIFFAEIEFQNLGGKQLTKSFSNLGPCLDRN